MPVWLTLAADEADAGALDCGADAILLRLGDGPDAVARQRARAAACAFIAMSRSHPARSRIFVEIAPLGDAANAVDLDALAAAAPDGVCLPQADGRAAIQQLAVRLAVREAEAGLPDGALRILARATQTPASIFGLGSYAGAPSRLIGLVFDAVTPGTSTARDLLLLGAGAAGVMALDASVDAAGEDWGAACRTARRDGFDGVVTRRRSEIARLAPIFSAMIDKSP